MTDETPGVDFPILLFDGHCNLCNGWVKFVLAHEKDDQVRFAPLQSNLGQSLLQKYGLAPDRIDTVVLIRHGRQFVKSTGALKLMSYLNFPWRLAQGLVLIPRPLRDWVYDLIARNRYRWFGTSPTCPLPSEDVRERFLA